MLPLLNVDLHCAFDSHETFGARIWHDNHGELRLTTIQRARVLEYERALPAAKLADHLLNGHITGRALCIGLGTEHFALAGAGEVARKLFIDRHAS